MMKQDSSCCLVMNLSTKPASLGGLGRERAVEPARPGGFLGFHPKRHGPKVIDI